MSHGVSNTPATCQPSVPAQHTFHVVQRVRHRRCVPAQCVRPTHMPHHMCRAPNTVNMCPTRLPICLHMRQCARKPRNEHLVCSFCGCHACRHTQYTCAHMWVQGAHPPTCTVPSACVHRCTTATKRAPPCAHFVAIVHVPTTITCAVHAAMATCSYPCLSNVHPTTH
jgi:hypothetical protein